MLKSAAPGSKQRRPKEEQGEQNSQDYIALHFCSSDPIVTFDER